jgi:hypothetical protein
MQRSFRPGAATYGNHSLRCSANTTNTVTPNNPNGTRPGAEPNHFPRRGTLLGAALAASFDAISRDQVCARNHLTLPSFPRFAKTQLPNGEVNRRQQGEPFKAIKILRLSQLTVELWRPAPDQTIKTNSPTQGDTQEKVPLLGSPTNDLLCCPHLTTAICKCKTNVLSTRHGAVVAGKVLSNSSTTLPAHNLTEKSRHDSLSFLYLSRSLQHAIASPRLARSWSY